MYFQHQFSSLNISCFIPEGILIFNLLLVLVIDLLSQKENKKILIMITSIGLLLSIATLLQQLDQEPTIAFLGNFKVNHFTTLFCLIIILCSALSIPLSLEYIECSGTRLTEFLIFMLFSTLAAMILCGANDLITIFIALESLGLGSYLLTGYMKQDIRSNEAAIKYLIIGGVSSSIFVYGLSWLYGLSGGNIELKNIANNFTSLDFSFNLISWIAYVFIIVGIGFKLSLVPFHRWSPDVYEGSPTPVVAFLSVVSKVAGLALTIQISETISPIIQEYGNILVQILAILSMVIGNVLAIVETSMKRMLAYSSISQAGYLLIGIAVGKENGYASLLVYIMFYLFMNLGAFFCIILFGLRTGTDQIRDYTGLWTKDPWLAASLSLCLLSLAGVPPLTGFFSKTFIFWSAWKSGLYHLTIIGIFTSIVSIYYYIRIVKALVVFKEKDISYYVKKYSGYQYSEYKYNFNYIFHNFIQFSINVCIVISSLIGIVIDPIIFFVKETILN
uniref:subunit 2 of NADH-plastoquinone oxidoreductase n=1 Tax=Nitella hyalina TaxID=181804 RepID=UPI00286B60C5|nr:subunit 2 of NADH-plastoquinone oxidoreductase [Nitella hyalina]WKT08412.1 subunit 2 of NADH-plastoquinone oxidoreductase [Nitella hyalina]